MQLKPELRRKCWPQVTVRTKVSPCSGTKGPDMTRTWRQEPFPKWRVCCAGRSGTEAPFTTPHHKRASSKALQSNQPCQHFHKPTRPPLTHKSLMEPQVRETDLSSASCLFAGQPCNKILCYLKNYCQHIGFYVLQAANPLLGNITPKITLWRNKINDITKKLCLGRGKSRK